MNTDVHYADYLAGSMDAVLSDVVEAVRYEAGPDGGPQRVLAVIGGLPYLLGTAIQNILQGMVELQDEDCSGMQFEHELIRAIVTIVHVIGSKRIDDDFDDDEGDDESPTLTPHIPPTTPLEDWLRAVASLEESRLESDEAKMKRIYPETSTRQ